VKLVINQFKSGWEMGVARSLLKNGIPFDYEPRSYPLNHYSRYTPDFVLTLPQGRRRVIIEPHGVMDPQHFHKFSMFREIYGNHFYMILLVRNDDIPFVPKEAYDDIWPIEYAELLFKKLRAGHVAQ